MCFALLQRLRAARAGRSEPSGPRLSVAAAPAASSAPGAASAQILADAAAFAAVTQTLPLAMAAPAAPAVANAAGGFASTEADCFARPIEPGAVTQTVPLAMPDAAAAPPASWATAPSGAGAQSAPEPASEALPASVDPRETDRRFSARVLAAGALCDGEPDAAQREVLQRLEETIRSAPDRHLAPRMPALLPRLLGLVRRDDVSTRELAEPLARDPALLGEVIPAGQLAALPHAARFPACRRRSCCSGSAASSSCWRA